MENSVEILNVPIVRVSPDPEVPNYRGPIRDTSTLQPSIKQDGILRPLWVRPGPNDSSAYFLIDGYRRWTAARVVGLEQVPVRVFAVDAVGARDLAMLANQTEEWPLIVLDKELEVIGGKCLAVRHLVQPSKKKGAKVPRYRVAEMMALTADVIGALYILYDDLPELRRRVENEQIQITVYSIFKKAPDDVKEYILRKRGNISARYIRGIMADWRHGKLDLSVEDPQEEPATDIIEPATSANGHKPQAENLGQALNWLRKAQPPFAPTELWTLNRIEETLVELMGETDDVLQ